ncbi:CinA family protein [Olivibacter sp. CPCC 100613]|uniref:CinA family protein n=1 Tax=Olivibacter sp. CPCC 100613 TaxID=3079931 RepID=UPI002FFADA28
MIKADSVSIEQCAKLLKDRRLTIAFAESATGGVLTSTYAKLPNAGTFLKGGIVCYDAKLKEELLGVPKGLIDQYSPESKEVTQEMAVLLKNLIDADVLVAVTGLLSAGGSESAEKPVGTMFYSIALGDKVMNCRELFKGTPDAIVSQTIEQIGKTITKTLINHQPSKNIVN